MEVSELLGKIREHYLIRFKQEIEEQKGIGFEIHIEAELVDESGLKVTEGFLNTPYRLDLFKFKNEKFIESILIDTESKLTFPPMILQWTNSLSVIITPFQWNYLTIELGENSDLDWYPLKEWFKNAFEIKNNMSEFKEVIHFISDPYIENNKQLIDLDLGSGTVEDFESLLDALDKMKLEQVIIR